MNNLLLDGTMIYIFESFATGNLKNKSICQQIERIVKEKNKIYYEAKVGQSHLLSTVHSHILFKKKLIALDEDINPLLYSGEKELLEITTTNILNSPKFIEAIQEYENAKKGPPRKRSTIIGYLVRLLLLARQLNACVWVWEARMKLINALFSDAGIKFSKNTDYYKSEYCVFPYLPNPNSKEEKLEYSFVDGNELNNNTTELINKSMKLFISYSHQDESFKDQLEKHLAILKRQNFIETWNDRMISASANWKNEIDNALEKADIILLLVSSDFCASDYIWDIEMKRALEKHDNKTALVIPIAIRPCSWKAAPFSYIQGLPRDLKPISQWENKDLAWQKVTDEIYELVLSQK